MSIKTFTVTHSTGKVEEFEISRSWGTLMDPKGHFQIKREIARVFPDAGMVVLTDAETKFYHVVDGFNSHGCKIIARIAVS